MQRLFAQYVSCACIIFIYTSCKDTPAQSVVKAVHTIDMLSYHVPDSIRPVWLAETYHHVIPVEQKHIAKLSGNYLLDIPLSEKSDATYVFYMHEKIPISLFRNPLSFYPSIRQFILIIPENRYDQDIFGTFGTSIYTEPPTAHYYYRIIRNADKIQIDSAYLTSGAEPKITYTKPLVPAEMTAVYRRESYGSRCCPKDPMWDIIGEYPVFIEQFEKKYKVKITGTYSQMEGLEGEHTNLYTLPDLTTEQRLRFIVEKRAQWIDKREEVKLKFEPQIFTPELIAIQRK